MRTFKLRNVYWLWLTALVMLLDQVSKQLVVKYLDDYTVKPLLPHLNLVHLHNTGAAFSMFSGASPLVFVVIGVVVSVSILIWLRRHPHGELRIAAALALIMGGALGNVIDRVTRGHVVDFIDCYWGGWHFAAFNVADAAITIGAGLMILDSFIEYRRQSPKKKEWF